MISVPDNLVDGGERAAARVRGLRASRIVPVHLCRHCGAPLVGEAAQGAGFCCAGCSYVFRVVHEQGLDGFYRIRDGPVPAAGEAVFQARDYAWLAQRQAEAEQGPGTPELTLEVQGISCAGCVWLIERTFDRQPGALHIETDAQIGRMSLRWTRGEFDASAFARMLQSFNYLVGPPGEMPEVLESRRLVRRVGLCAAFSMNVMLFTLPVYFGLKSALPLAQLFGVIAVVFATLSVIVGGGYFFHRAWQALRQGVLHIDLPISVGIAGAYAGSIYGWLAHAAQFVYLDFVAAFIFLMLVGRWAQVATVEGNRRRLLSAQARPDKVSVVQPDGTTAIRAVDTLQPGETFVVGAGLVVPVEAQLESAAATIGTAWISGEADPRTCRAGVRVPAGAINLDRNPIRLRATQGWKNSLLAELLRPARRDPYRHRFLERIVSGYLAGIFLVAVGSGAAWWFSTHDAVRTWSVVTAVLVVSCPCAIGLAFPLADEFATLAVRRAGVFVRAGDLWPRLHRIRRIVFDKTGTLTWETPQLANPAALDGLEARDRAALYTLVRENPHPVGQSLNEFLLARGRDLAVVSGEIRETTGDGVALQAATGTWTLGRSGWRGAASAERGTDSADAEFCRDGAVLARFSFSDAVRPEAREDIAALRAQGFQVCILSGDRREKVADMAGLLGLSGEDAGGEFSPRAKAEWITRLDRQDTLMLGDGANDSLAFDAAFARGTPVIHRGVLENKADFYYLGRSLGGLRRLFAVDVRRRRTQGWLLAFSVAYNLLAVGLAAAGHMNPLLAAVLMPVSSLATLAIVWLGMRGVGRL